MAPMHGPKKEPGQRPRKGSTKQMLIPDEVVFRFFLGSRFHRFDRKQATATPAKKAPRRQSCKKRTHPRIAQENSARSGCRARRCHTAHACGGSTVHERGRDHDPACVRVITRSCCRNSTPKESFAHKCGCADALFAAKELRRCIPKQGRQSIPPTPRRIMANTVPALRVKTHDIIAQPHARTARQTPADHQRMRREEIGHVS